MLPRLLDESERVQGHRPSLPAIHDLFGEHLKRTADKPRKSIRPPPQLLFSLEDLGDSLPADSRPPSPLQSQGWNSPKSAHTTSSRSSGPYSEYYSPRRQSISSVCSPPTSSSQDHFLTLPPIQHNVSGSISGWRPSLSSRRAYASHSRSRSTSEAAMDTRIDGSAGTGFKRRHTIGSASGRSIRFPYPSEPMPNAPESFRSSSGLSSPALNRSSRASPSLSGLGLPTVADDSSRSLAPSPSVEDLHERRKSPARYQCHYCGKRFNRPSSLKIHYNTHTGDKPYACPFPTCGRRFSVMSNMRRHTRIHGDAVSQQSRESSIEPTPDVPSPTYSSSSSLHATLVPSTSATSSAYSHPYTPSASPSPRLPLLPYPPSSVRESRRRHSIDQRSFMNIATPPASSDDDDSYLEH